MVATSVGTCLTVTGLRVGGTVCFQPCEPASPADNQVFLFARCKGPDSR